MLNNETPNCETWRDSIHNERCSAVIDAEQRFHHILLVEDNATDIFFTRRTLQCSFSKCIVDSITHGGDVVPFLKKMQAENCVVDFIVLDLGLRDIDGFEVLTELSQAPAAIRSVPIIILTGYSDFEYIKGMHSLPIVAYETKPLDKPKIEKVRQLIRPDKAAACA